MIYIFMFILSQLMIHQFYQEQMTSSKILLHMFASAASSDLVRPWGKLQFQRVWFEYLDKDDVWKIVIIVCRDHLNPESTISFGFRQNPILNAIYELEFGLSYRIFVTRSIDVNQHINIWYYELILRTKFD